MKILNKLQQQNKIRKKQLTKSCKEWAKDKEEQAEIKAWKGVEADGWED